MTIRGITASWTAVSTAQETSRVTSSGAKGEPYRIEIHSVLSSRLSTNWWTATAMAIRGSVCRG